jgi:hypothetical protein
MDGYDDVDTTAVQPKEREEFRRVAASVARVSTPPLSARSQTHPNPAASQRSSPGSTTNGTEVLQQVVSRLSFTPIRPLPGYVVAKIVPNNGTVSAEASADSTVLNSAQSSDEDDVPLTSRRSKRIIESEDEEEATDTQAEHRDVLSQNKRSKTQEDDATHNKNDREEEEEEEEEEGEGEEVDVFREGVCFDNGQKDVGEAHQQNGVYNDIKMADGKQSERMVEAMNLFDNDVVFVKGIKIQVVIDLTEDDKEMPFPTAAGPVRVTRSSLKMDYQQKNIHENDSNKEIGLYKTMYKKLRDQTAEAYVLLAEGRNEDALAVMQKNFRKL